MPSDHAILNSGAGAWAFQTHAERLSRALWVDVRETPAARSYVLAWDGGEPEGWESFVPYQSILTAGDKRLQVELFHRGGVATPRTYLLDTPEEVARLLHTEGSARWVLKYPTGCGAGGHRLLEVEVPLPTNWPVPYVVQEFIPLRNPEVYRLYGIGGELLGWNVRRFPDGVTPSPWVAHARGARYVGLGEAPPEAVEQAGAALLATRLLPSFGCADLLRAEDGRWLVLEVGTDGVFNHVDRDLSLPTLEAEIDQRIAEAFWAGTPTKPWGQGPWKLRPSGE